MLDNLHIAIIIKRKRNYILRRLSTSDSLSENLISNWNFQLIEFMGYRDEIVYTNCSRKISGYRFKISSFDLHSWLNRMTITDINSIPIVERNERISNSIVGVVAVANSRKYGEILLFQNFRKGFLIEPGSWLNVGESKHSYTRSDSRILRLDLELSAVYFYENKKFLFRSFKNTNMFYPLEHYSRQLFRSDIDFVFSHNLFHTPNKTSIYNVGDSIIRTRFAKVRELDILRVLTPNKVKNIGKELGTSVNIRDGRIVFPDDKKGIKDLLDVLTQRKFRTYFTNEIKVFS